MSTAERNEVTPVRQEVESVVVRFAGDSGDGMQLTGGQFTQATALAGNDLATFPDFPAEIRAPAGTTFGVSSFQINFGARVIKTSGDELDTLVAMNPAALKVEVENLKAGGLLIFQGSLGTPCDVMARKHILHPTHSPASLPAHNNGRISMRSQGTAVWAWSGTPQAVDPPCRMPSLARV